MKVRWLGMGILIAAVVGCTRTSAEPAPGPRYGAVMGEIGQRFERAGRAATAGRFELADFEVGELDELFTEDLPRAELPKEGSSAALASERDAFAKTYPARLKKAAAARDLAAFRDAFRDAAGACNACHLASGHGFIEIPTEPGKPIPDLDPRP